MRNPGATQRALPAHLWDFQDQQALLSTTYPVQGRHENAGVMEAVGCLTALDAIRVECSPSRPVKPR